MNPTEMARIAQQRRDRAAQLRQGVTQQQAASMAALARENPSLSAGALFAAGKAEIPAGSSASKAMGEADLKVKRDKGNWFQRSISAGYKNIKFVGSALTPDFVGDGIKGAAPAIKGLSRGADIGLSSIGQTFQGAFRESAADGDIRGSEWLLGAPNLAKGFRQSDLFQANREVQDNGGYKGLLTGETKVDYGSGFFAGGDVGRAAGAARTAASGQTRVGGKLPTLGRYLANEIGLEPGKRAFNIVSGLADLSMVIGTDPTFFSPAVAAKIPKFSAAARRSFSGEASRSFDAAGAASKVEDGLVKASSDRIVAAGGSLDGLSREQLVARALPFTSDQLVDEAGGIKGVRQTVNSDRAIEWLTANRRGQQVVEYLSKETDFGKLYDATKGKVDPKVLLRLSERQMSGDEVIAILGPELGQTKRLENKFSLGAVAKQEMGAGGLGTLASATFKKKTRDVRMFGAVPERVLRKDDIDSTLVTVTDMLRNAKVGTNESVKLPDGRVLNRSEILKRFVEADGTAATFDAAEDLMNLMASKAISEYGVSQAKATELFKMWKTTTSDSRKYWVDQIVAQGEKAYVNKAFNAAGLDDDGVTRALPHLASQFLDNNIPLPDPRDIRDVMSRFSGILGHGKDKTDAAGNVSRIYGRSIEVPTMALEKIQEQIFKPLVLLRPAFVVRNQIDEQFRPMGVGLNSLFNHPVQYLNWVISDQEGVGKLLSKAGFKSRGQTLGPDGTRFFDEQRGAINKAREDWKEAQRAGDPAAVQNALEKYEAAKVAARSVNPLTEGANEYARASAGGVGNWRQRQMAAAKDDVVFIRRDADFSRAVGEGLHRIANDPLAQRIARGVDIEQLKRDWWRGPLQAERLKLAKVDERMSYLNDEVGAAQYVDDTVKFIDSFVGQSPELRKAADTGRINGVPLTLGDSLQISPRAVEELDKLKSLDDFQGPQGVPGSRTITSGAEEESSYNQVVNWAFYQLADRPVKYLSRSPVFRQRYYKRMESMIGFLDEKAADDVIAEATAANLKGKDIKRMQSKRTAGTGLSYEEASLVAKADALEFTNDLFYTLTRRNQALDAMRLIFPFGEAFKDSAIKYSQISAQNPRIPYRLTQVIEAGRNADIDGDGQGFFYTDEQSGQEMFAFPGSQALLGMLGQQGAGQFRGPVQNLNILGQSVVPGFGPVVQLLAADALPDEVDFNKVREFISPYGDETLEGGALESLLPAWFNKFRTAGVVPLLKGSPEQQVQFSQSMKDWMGYLASTGEYDLQDPAAQERLKDDAKGKARSTWILRGMAQAFAPTPPSPEFVAYDKEGKIQTQFRLAEEYRKIMDEQQEAGTPEATNRIFIETFGEQAVLAVIPNTKAAEGRSPLPPNRKALEFYQNNKDAEQRFGRVFGLFAPDSGTEDFDFTTYNRALEQGDRVALTPDEAIQRANQNVARMIYTNAKEIVGEEPNKEQKAQLKDLKARLSEDFPGYSNNFTSNIPGVMEDLKRAAQDPVLGETPAGQGLQVWLKARDLAEQTAQQRYGVSWKQSDKAREVRDEMRALAERLSNDFDGFNNLYERALEREMKRD